MTNDHTELAERPDRAHHGDMGVVLAEAPADVEVRSSETHRLVDTLLRFRELALVIVLAIVVGGTYLAEHSFLSTQGIKDLLLNATILVIVAVGEAAVVMTGNVDLSVGSVVGLTAFMAGDLMQHNGNIAWAVIAAILLGAACGLVNGLLVSIGHVPALVVTLGTLYIFRGLDSLWVGSRQITAAELPTGFIDFGHNGIGPIPWLAILTAVVVAVVAMFLRRYRTGREFYAIGSSREAAVLAGVRVRRRIIQVFVLGGALAGLGGVLYTARFGNVDSGTATGFELTVVSAVVVGGVAFTGGSGTVFGAALGALLLTTISSALPALGVSSVWQNAIVGFLLLVAIAIDRVVALRLAALLKKRGSRRA